MFVAIEGIDGSGKGTQTQLLKERLRDEGFVAESLSFPSYSLTYFGAIVGRYLNGDFGENVHPMFASLIFAIDRFERAPALAKLLNESDVVIADRYTLSNLAHQGANHDPAERPGFRELLTILEHSVFGTLRPDMTILIDINATEAQKRIAAKKPRSYTEKSADIHEADLTYLARVRLEYLELATLRGIPVIHSSTGARFKSQSEIADEVYSLVIKRLRPATAAADETVFPAVDRTKLAQAIHSAWSIKRWHELAPQDKSDALREAEAALVEIHRQLALVKS
jgi:dTMP kinase